MCDAFPKPKRIMGEAWFMGERRMFPELCGNLADLTDEQVNDALAELASGPTSFGRREEWNEWYHYLLPRLLERRWGFNLWHPVEMLVGGFMAQYPDPSDRQPYPGFLTDALNTLGRYIMTPHFWPKGELDVSTCLNKFGYPNGIFGWDFSAGLLSSSLFFCLKYLPKDAVRPWLDSVFAIPDQRWRAQLFVWLIGAHPILSGEIGQPAQFPELGAYSVGWHWSWSLGGNYTGSFEEPVSRIPFLPPDNMEAVLQLACDMPAEEFFDDLQTDPELEQIAAETAGIRERFAACYCQGS
jgi:hypothetical protein